MKYREYNDSKSIEIRLVLNNIDVIRRVYKVLDRV